MRDDFDVIVVGAGPVGLWLACELKLAGVDVAVIERRQRNVDQSRALTMHGRTVEMFGLRGLADRFLSQGKPIPTGHYAMLETRLAFASFDTPYPFTLFLPQARTEEIIEARARELGVAILQGYQVESVSQDADGVAILGTTDTGPFRLTARYVVGCDGGRSVTRRMADIGFPGLDATRALMLGDVLLDMPPGKPIIAEFNGRGSVMIAPLGDGIHHRIVVATPDEADVALLAEPATLQDVIRMTEKVLGTAYGARDPIWLSRFSDETRLADAYRRGRIFLAGDAAHIHLPAGGQGMNVGLQDAFNLGWKLAAVINGKADAALLDSYEAERRPVGHLLHDNTLAQGALMAAFSPAGLALREEVSRFLAFPALNAQVAGQVSGFGILHDDPNTLRAFAMEAPGGCIGPRVPDRGLRLADGSEARLHGLLDGGNWLHLSIGGDAELPAAGGLSGDMLRRVRCEGPLDGFFEGMNALLVRPDGFAAGSI